MPNAYLDKLVEEGKGSKAELEAQWAKAKKMAQKDYEENPKLRPNYGYLVSIFQKLIGVKTEARLKIQAASRLKYFE